MEGGGARKGRVMDAEEEEEEMTHLAVLSDTRRRAFASTSQRILFALPPQSRSQSRLQLRPLAAYRCNNVHLGQDGPARTHYGGRGDHRV